jgi:hypothetical protein
MLGKCAKVILLWTAFFSVLWLCYGMVGTPSNVMAYIFCSALSVATFVPAMYETILLVGYMMLKNIPSDDAMDEWDDASLSNWRDELFNDEMWDVTIGAKEGMFFHLYQDDDPAFDNLFVGDLCERDGNIIQIIDRQHFNSRKLCVDWFLQKATELESWGVTNPIS